MADYRLAAEARTEFGKGSARRTRRAGRIPAVLYGHGQDVVHLSLPAREFAAALRNGGANALLTIELDGKEQLALTKAVQRDPLTRQHEHVDLLLVRRGEKHHRRGPDRHRRASPVRTPSRTTSSTPSRSRPTPPGCRTRSRSTSPARTAGDNITAGDLPLPAGSTLITDADALVDRLPGRPERRRARGRAGRGRGRGRHRARGVRRGGRGCRRGRRRPRAAGPGQRRVDGVGREVRPTTAEPS